MRLALEFEDGPVSLLYDLLFGLSLTTEADDNDSHVRCTPEGLRLLLYRAPARPNALSITELGFCSSEQLKWLKGWTMVLKGQLKGTGS